MPLRGPAPARAHCWPSCSISPIFAPEKTRPPTLENVPGHTAVPHRTPPPHAPQNLCYHRCFTAGGQHNQAPPLTRAQKFIAENLAGRPRRGAGKSLMGAVCAVLQRERVQQEGYKRTGAEASGAPAEGQARSRGAGGGGAEEKEQLRKGLNGCGAAEGRGAGSRGDMAAACGERQGLLRAVEALAAPCWPLPPRDAANYTRGHARQEKPRAAARGRGKRKGGGG